MARKPKKIPISNILRQNVHGHPFSSKYVNDDWGTIAFSIPRNELHKAFIEDEFYYSCIYFLIGQRDGKEVTYVGQTDKHNDPKKTAIQRILDHNKNILEKYYNDWNAIVLVTNKNDTWNAADLKALENAFYHEIPADIRLNGLEPNSGRPDFSKYTDKIDQIKSYITAIGYNVFPEYDESTDIGIIDEKTETPIQAEEEQDNKIEDIQKGQARVPEFITPKK